MHILAIFLPLISALIVGFGKRFAPDNILTYVSCVLIIVSTSFGIYLFFDVAVHGNAITIPLMTWFDVGEFHAGWGLKFDTLSTTMIGTVLIVSAMVHVYSLGYMHHDENIVRFMSYLSLFTFFMLMLVTADNLVQLFFGWEGVGLTSYLLIGFWNHKESANDASMKAFLVNRVGDIGFALGIFAVFAVFKTVNFDQIFAAAPALADTTFHFLNFEIHTLTLISLLLFVGAMAKSAQFGLHTWLPDAMEGPTPVSALIHAATMVTAGVFMLARMSPMLELAPTALLVIAALGAVTAIFAATVALTQNDIKRVIAYSTCSQLGYMVFAIGVSAYSVAVFHLVTHAFFKALLFLGAGAVIHAMSDEQDMRKMGGLAKSIPIVYSLMWIGSLALMGVPFFAGYFSKDAILESALGSTMPIADIVYWVGVTVALLTAFYSGRVLFMTFHGESKADEKVMAHVHEPPVNMLLPLIVLAVGAIFSGFLGKGFFVTDVAHYWGTTVAHTTQSEILEAAHHMNPLLIWMPTIVGLNGLSLSYVFYVQRADIPEKIVRRLKPLYNFSFNKWYVDEVYNALFINPSLLFGKLFWVWGDQKSIDRFGPDGIAKTCSVMATRLRTIHSGYVTHYAFAMLVGVVAVVTWVLYKNIYGGL